MHIVKDSMNYYMRLKGFKNADLARACGVSTQTISNFRNNVYTPSVKTLEAVCKALGCKPEDILERG